MDVFLTILDVFLPVIGCKNASVGCIYDSKFFYDCIIGRGLYTLTNKHMTKDGKINGLTNQIIRHTNINKYIENWKHSSKV